MGENRKGRRIVRNSTDKERTAYRKALDEERAGREANKALGREVLRTRRELSATVSELKAIREELGISLTDLADRTGMTVGNLSRLENMDGSNPTIETLRRYARGIGRRIEIAVVAEQ